VLAALEQAGHSLIGVFSCHRPGQADPVPAIRDAPAAACNLVVSTSGLALADFMYATYQIPYVVGLPVGRQGLADVLALLEGRPGTAASQPARPAPFRHALVIGEPVLSYGPSTDCAKIFLPEVDVVSVTPTRRCSRGSGCL
jgi:hypothetical protein